MSNTERTILPQPAFQPPTPEELQQTIRSGHARQARALRVLLRRSAQWLRRTLMHFGASAWRVMQAVGEWRRRRRTRAELGGLSDVVLKDIGVCRSEIPWLAQHSRSDHPSRTIAVARLHQRLPRRLAPVLPGSAAPPDKHAA